MTCGKIYILGGPIGNLEDITLRALETLKSVAYIVSEDTRETTKLLNRYSIQADQISYRDQNHTQVAEKLVNILKSGSDLALVSDSGTPLISDPGFKLVELLKKESIDVITIPGPSAAIAALSVSGLPTDKFTFLGFLPKKASEREKLLKLFGETPSTLIIYESPYRIKKLLAEIESLLGNRIVSICRELTKIHEEVITKNVSELIESKIKQKGEFTVLVAKKGYTNE